MQNRQSENLMWVWRGRTSCLVWGCRCLVGQLAVGNPRFTWEARHLQSRGPGHTSQPSSPCSSCLCWCFSAVEDEKRKIHAVLSQRWLVMPPICASLLCSPHIRHPGVCCWDSCCAAVQILTSLTSSHQTRF